MTHDALTYMYKALGHQRHAVSATLDGPVIATNDVCFEVIC